VSSFQASRSRHPSPAAQRGAELLSPHPLPALPGAWPAAGSSSPAALRFFQRCSSGPPDSGVLLCPESSGYSKVVALKCAFKMNAFCFENIAILCITW